MARFRAEARYAAALSRENIAQVYDYGEAAAGQPPYLVMELVTRTSLEAVLADGPLDAAGTMDIVAQTAAGLWAAHAAGMVHRDVKPGNLLLSSAGTVKITDFGIAHTVGSAAVTATGELLGTPAYVAPERVMGERAGPASDLYSLGSWPMSAWPAPGRSPARRWMSRWPTETARCRRCTRLRGCRARRRHRHSGRERHRVRVPLAPG